jgi:two-component system response regulator LytT
MKIKVICKDEKKKEYKNALLNNDIEFNDDEYDLVLVDPNYKKTEILGKNTSNEYVILQSRDIVFVESFGHEISAHTLKGEYSIKEKLYEIEGLFEHLGFIRIHRSYVINKMFIKTIKPTFNTKFIITMKNDRVLEVSRSYYYIFKSSIGL